VISNDNLWFVTMIVQVREEKCTTPVSFLFSAGSHQYILGFKPKNCTHWQWFFFCKVRKC